MIDIPLEFEKNVRRLRHRLHELAELSGSEHHTAAFVRGILESYNPQELISELGGTGVAAVFSGKENGPVVLLRAELDALPIREKIDLEYASHTHGVSHKCGHDGHMAILAGAASLAGKHGIQRGRLVVLFQPAEETGEGAHAILKDPKFKKIRPDVVFALHNLPGYPEKSIIVRNGNFAASSRGMIIRLTGHTSHAGHPEDAKSPVLALATLLKDLTALPALSTGFTTPALITIVHARLGAVAFGTTPGDAEIMATLRTYDTDVMQKLADKASMLARETARGYGLHCDIGWTENFDPTCNSAKEVDIVRKIAKTTGAQIIEQEKPFPWSEDFGSFTEAFPGALFGLGAGVDVPQLHTGEYDFPDVLIPQGIRMFAGIIDHYLKFAE